MIVCREQYPYRIIVVFKIVRSVATLQTIKAQNEHPSSTLFTRGGGVPSPNSDIIFAAVMVVVKIQVTIHVQDTRDASDRSSQYKPMSSFKVH